MLPEGVIQILGGGCCKILFVARGPRTLRKHGAINIMLNPHFRFFFNTLESLHHLFVYCLRFGERICDFVFGFHTGAHSGQRQKVLFRLNWPHCTEDKLNHIWWGEWLHSERKKWNVGWSLHLFCEKSTWCIWHILRTECKIQTHLSCPGVDIVYFCLLKLFLNFCFPRTRNTTRVLSG